MSGPPLDPPEGLTGFIDLLVYHSVGWREDRDGSPEGRICGLRETTEDEKKRGFPDYMVLVEWYSSGQTNWVPITHLSPVSPLRQLAQLG